MTRFNATAGGTCEVARIEDTPEEGTEEVSAAVRLLLLRVPVTAVAYKGWNEGIQQVRREITRGITRKIVRKITRGRVSQS